MQKSLFFIVLLFTLSWFQDVKTQILGKWKTIDDATQEPKSYVEIYQENNKFYGKVIAILDPAKKESTCLNCPDTDPRKNQKIEGMVILRDLELVEEELKNGHILDPKKGKEYHCKAWLEKNDPNTLKVRGYIGLFYRTQTWVRAE